MQPAAAHPVADEHVIAALGMIERLGRYPLRTLDGLHLAIARGIQCRQLAWTLRDSFRNLRRVGMS